MARLFLAISLPAQVKEKLAELQNKLAASGAGVRWVRPEGIHLTLKFLGNVPESRIPEIVSVVQEVVRKNAPAVIRLGVKGVGTFPPRGTPRVVWAGLTGDLVALARLQQALEAALARLGFAPEKRPFVPHLTLGRVKSAKNKKALLQSVDRYREEEFVPAQTIAIKELVLYQSTLHPEGAIYTPLKHFPFKQ